MSIYDNMQQVKRDREQERIVRNEQYKVDSRNRLGKILKKKIDTAYIGAISVFEEAFGDLWGHGKLESELTSIQNNNRKIWGEVRNRIFNNGNNQVRAMQKELEEYDIVWLRHRLQLMCKSRQEENDG